MADLHDHVRRVGPAVWAGGIAVAALGILIYHEWAHQRGEDGKRWLDPGQPPIQLAEAVTPIPSDRPRQVSYPDSLVSWPVTPVGDC